MLIEAVASGLISYLFTIKGFGRDSIYTPLSESVTHDLLISLFSTSTALMGFVLAAGTFLISHVKDEAFTILRRSKSFPALTSLISSSIWRLFGLAVISLLMLFAAPQTYVVARMATVYFTVWSGLGLASTTWIVVQILSVPTKS